MAKFQVVLAFLVAACVSCASAQTHTKQTEREQTHFSAEDEDVHHPVAIPDKVWEILKRDKFREVYLDGGSSPAEPQRSWFSAALVHLQDASKTDYVVEAKGPLRGANVDTFWVFLDTPNGMKLVLTAAVHDLSILSRRWNGVRTIELDGATCCQITMTWLRYENGKFEIHRQITKNI
jgi:hypothetical protein